MAPNGTRSKRKALPQDVQMTLVADLITADAEEIKQRTDSVIQNIGALRFALNRIELLEELLVDARAVIDTHGPKDLVKKIDNAFKEK